MTLSYERSYLFKLLADETLVLLSKLMSKAKKPANKIKVTVPLSFEPTEPEDSDKKEVEVAPEQETEPKSDPEPIPEPEPEPKSEPEPESKPEPKPEPEPTPPPRKRQSLEGIKRRPRPIVRRHEASNLKFWVWAVATITLSSTVFASALPHARNYLSHKSAQLGRMGESTNPDEAELDFHLATILDPGSPTAAWHYAAFQLKQGRPTAALATLNRGVVVRESPEARVIRIKAELETSQTDQAALVARTIIGPNATDDQLALAALALATAGQGREVGALQARVSSPDALRTITQAGAGNVALAQALSASGLSNSARGVLEKLSSTAPRDLLLARLYATANKKADLSRASALYARYLSNTPADAAVRNEYAGLLSRLNQKTEATLQQKLASDLQSGRP